NSSNLTEPSQASSCVFYDITQGDNGVPGQPGYAAGKGYDMSSGLGSVNAANLVAAWSAARKLRSNSVIGVGVRSATHGQPIQLALTVKPATGGGVPSGDFSLIAGNRGAVFGGTLAKGEFAGNVSDLPGGVYNFVAHYAGDAMFAGSNSNSVPIHIYAEESLVN